MIPKQPISRQTFLRGVGVSLALPWLESLRGFGGRALAATDGPPMRMAVVFAGNGFHNSWTASGQGASMELGAVLTSLKPFREKLNFIEGLYNEEAYKITDGIHACQTGQLLSGAPLAGLGAVRSGTSMDQVVAQKLAWKTKVSSLVLGCEPVFSNLSGGSYSDIYSSNISWSSPTTPTPLELYPALAFDRLFRSEPNQADRSVLDSVLSDAEGLRSRVNSGDRRRVDEYLNSVREVEKRIEQAGRDQHLEGWRPTLDKVSLTRPPAGTPQDIAKHMRLMCDLVVLAFQTDTTRVCTLKLNNDHSQLRFPSLGINEIHHLLSHVGGENWLKVNQLFVEQVAYIAGRLDAIQEGERTLLDNTNLIFLSSMIDGLHNVDRLPVVTIGGGARMKTGQVLNYRNDPNRQICRLYLSLMEKMGVRLEQFGDADKPLSEI